MFNLIRAYKFFWLVLVITFFSACNSDKKLVYELDRLETIDSFRDSVFFSDITGMLFDNNGLYYFVDSESSLILKTDTLLKLVDTFGKKGIGPLELETPLQIELYKDHLFICDEYSGKLVRFTRNGEALSSINFNFFVDAQFSIHDEKIYAFNSDLDGNNAHPIALYNIENGDFITSFGEKVESSGELFFNRHNLVVDDYLISTLAHNIPLVELYNLKGELLQRADFSKHPIIERRVKDIPRFINREPSGAIRTSEVFVCADYSNGYLYLLFTDWSSTENNLKPNYIFKVLVNPDTIKIESIYKINDGWYESFIIGANNTLITYERQNGVIESYRLPH